MSQTRKQKILGDVKRARRRRTLATTVIVAVLMVSIVVVAILLTGHNSSSNGLIGAPISTALYSQLSGVSDATLLTVRPDPGVITPLTSEPGPVLTSGGKPEVLYIGADYCPFCAAERWSLVVALSKFGSFTGLTYMQSADSPEAYPNTPTFSFHGATYTSQYVSFVSVEQQDRNKNPLETTTSQEQSILQQYDPQYYPHSSIPFVDVANLNVTYNGGSQFSPGVLSGMNWTEIGSQLDNPSTAVAKAVDGAAKNLISAICKADGSTPSSLCGQTFSPPTMSPPIVDSLSFNVSNTIIAGEAHPAGSSWRNSPSVTR
jgi:uncharacterized protein DUF929